MLTLVVLSFMLMCGCGDCGPVDDACGIDVDRVVYCATVGGVYVVVDVDGLVLPVLVSVVFLRLVCGAVVDYVDTEVEVGVGGGCGGFVVCVGCGVVAYEDVVVGVAVYVDVFDVDTYSVVVVVIYDSVTDDVVVCCASVRVVIYVTDIDIV